VIVGEEGDGFGPSGSVLMIGGLFAFAALSAGLFYAFRVIRG
jgi:hypothetical protein